MNYLQFVYFVLLVSGTVHSVPVEGDGCERQLKCVSSHDSPRSGYEPGKSYLYKYDAQSVTKQPVAGHDPEEAVMGLSATVRVDIDSESVATLHVVGVEMDQTHVSSDDLEYMSLPIKFSFCNCKVDNICSDRRDPDWSVNIKKGILSSLQFTLSSQQVSEAVGEEMVVLENTIHGSCDTRYQKTAIQNGVSVFNKTIDSNSCSNHSRHIQSAIQGDDYSWKKNTSFLEIRQQCQLHLTEQKIVSQSVCVDRVSVASMPNIPATPEAEVRTSLVYVHTAPLRNVARIDSNSAPQSLKHVHAKPMATNAEERRARDILRSLSENEAATKQTAIEFSKLVRVMKGMNYRQLNALWTEALEMGTRAESTVQDALPVVGTGASVKMIVKLIKEEKFSQARRDLFYMSMPFLQNPSKDVLVASQEIMEADSRGPTHKPLILGVSSVVHNYCHQNSNCIEESSVEKILGTLMNILKREGGEQCYPTTPQAEEKVVLIMKAIGNIGRVNEEMKQGLVNCMKNMHASHSVRVAAIEAFRRCPCDCTCPCSKDTIVSDALDQLLRNKTEDSEIRIASYLQHMRCPCNETVHKIRNVMQDEELSHVSTFIWSHLTNLQETNSPIKEYSRILLDNMDLPKNFFQDSLKYARNMEMSSYNYSAGHGVTSDSNLIYSHDSFIPRSLMQNLTVDIFGKSYNLLEFGLRNEGFQKILEDILNPANFVSNKPAGSWSLFGLLSEEKPNYEHISKKAQEGVLKSLLKSPLVESYVRIFGNEMSLVRSEREKSALEMIRSAAQNIKNLIVSSMESLKNSKKSWHHSSVLMDSSVSIPTFMGVPVKMSVWATGSLALEFESKHNNKPGAFLTSFKIKPSGAIVAGHDMSLDSQLFASGVRTQSSISTDTGIEVSVGHVKGRKVAALVNLPKKKMNLININTQVHSFTRTVERGEQSSRRASLNTENVSRCYTGLSKITGVKLCMKGEMSDSSPLSFIPSAENNYRIPLVGKGGLSVELIKTDESLSGYMITGEYDPNKHAVYFKFDTPDSKVDRKIEVEAVFMAEREYQAALNIRSPWKQAKVQINYENQPQRKLIKVVVESERKRWMGLAETSCSITNGSIELHPHVMYSVPGMQKPYSIKGVVLLEKPGQITMDVKSDDNTMQVKGSVKVKWEMLRPAITISMDHVTFPGVFLQGDVSASYEFNIIKTMVSVTYGQNRERILYHGKIEHNQIDEMPYVKVAADLRASAYPQYSGTFQSDVGVGEGDLHARVDIQGQGNFALHTRNHVTFTMTKEKGVQIEYKGHLNAQPRNVDAEASASLKLNDNWEGQVAHGLTVKSSNKLMWHSRTDAIFSQTPQPITKVQSLVKTANAEYVFSQILKLDTDGYWRGHGDLISKPGAQYTVHTEVFLSQQLIEVKATAAHRHLIWRLDALFENSLDHSKNIKLSLDKNGISVMNLSVDMGKGQEMNLIDASFVSEDVTVGFTTGYVAEYDDEDSVFGIITGAEFHLKNALEVKIPSWNWMYKQDFSVKHAGEDQLSFTLNSQSQSQTNVQIEGVARLPVKDRTFVISGRGHVRGEKVELNAAGELGKHMFDGKHHLKANVKLPKEVQKIGRDAKISFGAEGGIGDPFVKVEGALKVPRKLEYLREPFNAELDFSIRVRHAEEIKFKSAVDYKGNAVDGTAHFSAPNLTGELSFSSSRPSKSHWVSQARLIANSNVISAAAVVDSSAPDHKSSVRVDISAPQTSWKKATYTRSTKYQFGDVITMEKEEKLSYSDKDFVFLQQWEGSRQEKELKGKIVVHTPFTDYTHQSVKVKMEGGSITKQKGTVTLVVQNMSTDISVDYDITDRNNINFETEIKTPFKNLPQIKIAFEHKFPSWNEGLSSSLKLQNGNGQVLVGHLALKVGNGAVELDFNGQFKNGHPVALQVHFQKDASSSYSARGVGKYGELTAKVEGKVSYESVRHFNVHLDFEIPLVHVSVASVNVKLLPVHDGLAFHFDIDSPAIGKIFHTKVTSTKASETYQLQVEIQWDVRKLITVSCVCNPMQRLYSVTVQENGQAPLLIIRHNGRNLNRVQSSLQVLQHMQVISEREQDHESLKNKLVASYGSKKIGYEFVMYRESAVMDVYALERVIRASSSWRQRSVRGVVAGDVDVSLALDHSRKPQEKLQVKSSIQMNRQGDQYQVTGSLSHPSLPKDVELSGVYKHQVNQFSGFDRFINLNVANFQMSVNVKSKAAEQSYGSGRNQTVSVTVAHEGSHMSASVSVHVLPDAPYNFGYVANIKQRHDEKTMYFQTKTKHDEQDPKTIKTNIWCAIPGVRSQVSMISGVMESVDQGERRFARVSFNDDQSANIYSEWQWQKEHPVAPLRSLMVRVGDKDEESNANDIEISGEWIGNNEIRISGNVIQGDRRTPLGSAVFSLHTSRALEVTGNWDKKSIKQIYERLSARIKSIQEHYSHEAVQHLGKIRGVYVEVVEMMKQEAGVRELVQYYQREMGDMVNEWIAEIDVQKVKEQLQAMDIFNIKDLVVRFCRSVSRFLDSCTTKLRHLHEGIIDRIPNWLRPYLGLPQRHHWLTKLVRHVAPAYSSDSASDTLNPEIEKIVKEILEMLKVAEEDVLYISKEIEEYIVNKLRNVPTIIFNLIDVIRQFLSVQYPDLVPYFDKLIEYLEQYCRTHTCWPWYQPRPIDIAKFISYYYAGRLDEFDTEKGKLRYSVYLPRPVGSLAGVPTSVYRGIFNESWPVLPRIPSLPDFHRSAMIVGGKHWVTFDNNLYTFEPKRCEYLLAKDFSPKERFTLKLNEHQMQLDLPHHKIVLQSDHSKVFVDGKQVNAHSPHSQLHTEQYDILFEGDKVTVSSHPPDVQIKCFGINQHTGYCTVILSDWLQGRSLGLLGTNDGNRNNDFVTPSGQTATNLWEFLKGYKVDPNCDDRVVARETETISIPEVVGPSADIDPLVKWGCDEAFNKDRSSLKGCIQHIPPSLTADYYRQCYQTDARHVCSIVKSYFHMCVARGFGPPIIRIPDICY